MSDDDAKRWAEKTEHAIGMPSDPDAIPTRRYQVLHGSVFTLVVWKDGSTARGQVDLEVMQDLVGKDVALREGWYDALGNFLGDDAKLGVSR